MLSEGRYWTEYICSSDQLTAYYQELERIPRPSGQENRQWIFRGQQAPGKGKYDMESSIEKYARGFGYGPRDLPELENKLTREFQRRLHQYTSDVPKEDNRLEWLSLMQHHGAPTRLLDWTYSFFAAAFFALKEPNENGYEIWALDADYFSGERFFRKRRRDLAKLVARLRRREAARSSDKYVLQEQMLTRLWRKPKRLVVVANPWRLTQRLTIQQGVFLLPGSLREEATEFPDEKSVFEWNLEADGYNESVKCLVRFKIPSDTSLRTKLLDALYRMNMSAATLFPGLDGFARSLWTRRFPDIGG